VTSSINHTINQFPVIGLFIGSVINVKECGLKRGVNDMELNDLANSLLKKSPMAGRIFCPNCQVSHPDSLTIAEVDKDGTVMRKACPDCGKNIFIHPKYFLDK
jgi:hypothetical protein